MRTEHTDSDHAAATALELLERTDPVHALHPAQDVLDGTLWYGIPAGGALVSITSKREAHRADALPAGIALRHTELGASTVTRDVALRFLSRRRRRAQQRVVRAQGVRRDSEITHARISGEHEIHHASPPDPDALPSTGFASVVSLAVGSPVSVVTGGGGAAATMPETAGGWED